jgi:uncharacterized protein YodC (DUF2158 family)
MAKFNVGEDVIATEQPDGIPGKRYVGMQGVVIQVRRGGDFLVEMRDGKSWSYGPGQLRRVRPYVKPAKKSELLAHGIGDYWVSHKEGASIIKVEPIEGRPKELKVHYKYWIKLRQQSGFIIIGKYAKRDRAFSLIRKYAQERMKAAIGPEARAKHLAVGNTILVHREPGVREEAVTVHGVNQNVYGAVAVGIQDAKGVVASSWFPPSANIAWVGKSLWKELVRVRKQKARVSKDILATVANVKLDLPEEPFENVDVSHVNDEKIFGKPVEPDFVPARPLPVPFAIPFKVGDVVRLKSGGPKMTVNDLIDPWKSASGDLQPFSLRCEGFSKDDSPFSRTYLPEMLERA